MAQNSRGLGLSFRWQITLLGAMVAVLFAASLSIALIAMRYTRSAVLAGEMSRVADAARRLALAYEGQERVKRPVSEVNPLAGMDAQVSQKLLSGVSQRVLEGEPGIEGGFYQGPNDIIVGYGFPAYEGANEEGEIPAAIKPPILEAAQEAVRTGRAAERVVDGTPDLLLIQAVPIRTGQSYAASAWAIKRLSAVPGSNRLRAYLVALALGLAALFCVILTLFVVRNLQRGVRKIEGGLATIERDLSCQIAAENDPEEIQRIAQAVNLLARNLKHGIENEKQIENKLRHTERLAALGRLVAGVAHEVRNPLATIRLRVQMCEQSAQSPAVLDSCAVALEEIERLNGMVGRLLSFAQPVQLHAEPTELSRLIEQRLSGFEERARQQAVRFLTDFRADPGPLDLDQNRMAQVFDNLIQNALEAMADSGGTLSVSIQPVRSVQQRVGEVSIEFRDSGKGMSAETVGRIFDPFFTTKPSGTGLGLSICHELVRAHGGEIQVESAERRGTSVRILLPFPDGAGSDAAQVRQS